MCGVEDEGKRLFWFADEFPGHVEKVDLNLPAAQDEPDLGSRPLEDSDVTIIEKSNLLLLGPSGVGKTYSRFISHLPTMRIYQLTTNSPPNALPHPRSPLRNRGLLRPNPSRLHRNRH